MTTVIHILSDANLSGAPIHALQLVSGLKKFNHTVICPEGSVVTELKKAGAQVHIFTLSNKLQFGSITRLRSVLTKVAGESALIHCHGVRAGLFGRLAARGLNFPVVYTEHSWTKDYNLPNPINSWMQKRMLRYLDQFTTRTVAVSQAVADFLIDEGIAKSDTVERIYNGITIPTKPLPLQHSHCIGSVGSLTWQKNYSFLIDIIRIIKESVPDIHLGIVGEGPERQKLEMLIEDLDLQKHISLVGSVAHEKLPDYYKNWSLYVQSSTNESFGIALAEAIAVGLPALGSRVGSIPEILGDAGATFGKEDAASAAELIIKHLTDDKKRTALRDAELKHIQQFSEAKMLESHQALYEKLSS